MAQTMSYTKKPLVFKVTRREPELIAPAGPTPYEIKELSEIDNQDFIRFQLPLIAFYKNNGGGGRDPVKVVKEALGKALVWYYPFAGRVREKERRKLVVECTGEGVLFIEADADVTLKEFGEPLHPPFPCLEELLYDVYGSSILDTHVLVIQVTRLKCGGFVIAFRLNHTMADAQGIAQFLKAMSELAIGAQTPSMPPVWERHLLSARDPPRVTCEHRAYDEMADIKSIDIPSNDPVQHKSFYFGSMDIATLRRFLPTHTRYSTFDVISASLWRCYTIALRLDPEEEVRMLFLVNARTIFNPHIESGYYGNVIATPIAYTTADKLASNPLSYALDLIKKAKGAVTQEYMMSFADLMALKGRPPFMGDYRTFVLSDATRAQSIGADFGWGQPTYLGPAESGIGALIGGFYVSIKDEKGEKGIVVSISLPRDVMEVFAQEMNKLLHDASKYPCSFRTSHL